MKSSAVTFFILLATAAASQATILPPTGSPPVPPSAFTTPVTGPYLADTGLQNYQATNSLGQTTITGEYRATVYADPANSFCAGCLDFFVAVTSDASSMDAIERITLASFSGFLTDVGYSVGPGSVNGGIVPSTVDRSSNGSVVGFNFALPGSIGPGENTQVLEIQTNALRFMTGTLQIIDSSVASVPAFEPCPVPEAGSAGMTLIGALLLAGWAAAKRRRRAGSGPNVLD